MIFVPNMIAIITSGKNAGKKAVVIKQLDERTVLTACMVRVPVESRDSDPKWVKRRNAKFYVILKRYNICHLLATRYKADIGLGSIDYTGLSENAETKRMVTDRAKDVMMKAWNENKTKFLFSSLVF